ncbi:hypothetical protein [Deinococcus aestuarii]|uniref:hypothetical protein n=1 Tax=Deinococcus aestuarii TaxID=2774531 RepID=UPI001C0BAF2E|nr:hypothetical protein [Deinococcus aestuarii]
MGEAKRRKQLGLMPTVHPFEAQMDADGHVTLTRGPEDAELRGRIEAALKTSQPYGPAWDSEYRTSYVMAGRPDRLLNTAEDVQAIPVPALRRFSGDLVLGQAGEGVGLNLPVEGGGHLRLRGQQHSFDGARWEGFPTGQDPRQVLEFLMQHPALNLRGEVVASFLVEHWPEGRIDIEPEPPEELLEAIEAVAREWHGETPGEWAQTHHELLEQEEGPVPVARRLRLELRQPAPLQSPLSLAFATRGNVEFHPDPEGSSYSLDGETWHSYGDPDAEPAEDGTGELGELLSNMLDVQTVPVTVWADGRVEWEEGAVPGEHADRVRADLIEATGAGNPDAWGEWTRNVLVETFAGEAPHLAEQDELPAVQGVRLDLPTDALTDPDDPAQYFMESEVTFDGEHWRDLYAEDLPEELGRLRPSN